MCRPPIGRSLRRRQSRHTECAYYVDCQPVNGDRKPNRNTHGRIQYYHCLGSRCFGCLSGISRGSFYPGDYAFSPGSAHAPTPPRTAIVLCLRGRDPFLEKCLESLLKQDYPDYQLHVVVDNRQDPAWQVAESLANRYGADRVCIETLDERRDTCSLKCSSVTQAIGRLDESFQVAALVDADTMPHPSWLGELTAPLADEHIGAATGNRWYMPGTGSWGALVRYLWNAAAVVQMYWYEIAWGGTLAVKRKVIDELGLLDRWRHAFCEDTMLCRQLGKHGLRVKFVPSLMMVNREDCGLGACLSWIRRQLLTARLYHPLWPLVLLHGLGTTLVLAVAVVVTAIAALRRRLVGGPVVRGRPAGL